ncbi:MAG: nitroreductase family protein [Patescibacteria group bacterium]
MNILTTIMKRHSVRSYLDKNVEEEKIEQICMAGLHSPSARNRQPYRVIVVTERDLLDKVVTANDRINFWMKEAPVIFVICSSVKSEGREQNKFIDVGIMTENMMLMAADLDLGTCACAAFDQQKIKDIFGIPADYFPVLCLPCGYPSQKYRQGIDVTKIYEKVVHTATHYKGRSTDDIFTRNQF